jgi:hypothetical protein
MTDFNYEFRTVETPTGEKRYLYTNTNTGKETELADQATYDRLKAKFGAASDQAYAEADSGPADLNDFARDTKAKLRARKASGTAAGGNMKKGGKVKKLASGGKVSSASKRADGCATKGKTKGRMI